MSCTLKYFTLLVFTFFLSFYGFSQSKITNTVFDKVEQYIKEDNKEEALKLAIAQLESVTNNNTIPLQIKWNSKIGQLFSKNNNFPVALAYYNTAKELSIKSKDSLAIATAYFDIGSLNLNEYSNIIYQEQNINAALDKKEAAFKNFNYLIANFKDTKNTEEIIAKTYANLTGLYSYSAEYTKAENASEKAITYYTKLKDTISIIGVKINLSASQIYQKEFKKAKQTCLSFLPFLKDTSNIKILRYKEINASNLALIYGSLNNLAKSIDYLEESHKLNLVYLEKTSNRTLEEIEAKHNEESARQEEIAKTNVEIEKREKGELWFGIAGLSFLSLLLFGTVVFRNSKLKARNLSLKLIQKEYNQQQELQKLKELNQNKVLNAILEGRLKERKYIAQTLHDSVSSLLSSANMHLLVAKKKNATSIDELEKSQRIIGEASEKVRDLSHKLISAILLKFGLEHALYDLCEKYSNQELQIELESEDKIPRFSQDCEIKMHNITEECINNIIKHSKASKAIINLKLKENIFFLEISDNGIGFDTSKISPDSGIGLSQIIARIDSVGGVIKINSEINKGTKIFIKVPIDLI